MIRVRVFRGAMGFTLLETLVVIAIIGLATVVAIPYFNRLSRRQRLVSAAHEIQSSLMAARMRAVRNNLNASLVITLATGAEANHHLDLVVHTPAPTPTPFLPGFLPRNAVEFVTTPTGSQVTFGADGRMISETVPTPAVITVQGPVGSPTMNQVTIRTSSNGKVQVVTPAVWQ